MNVSGRVGQRRPDSSFSSPQASGLAIPDHDLVRPIGKGSYGEVWLVLNRALGSYRAAKFIRRDVVSQSRAFEREFAGIKKFDPVSRTHPGLVHVLHVGRSECGEYFYYVMELADDVASGQRIDPEKYSPKTLAGERARRRTLLLGECVQIGLSLAGALRHLHQHRLIHRDIKPANIIFTNGMAKLADIGLVAAIDETNTSLGTKGYVPRDEQPGPAADIYSLGMVLYEASTGQVPAQFPDLPARWAEIGDQAQFRSFNEVVLKACERNPSKRYPSAEALLLALGRCLDSGSERERGDGARGRAVRRKTSERKHLTALMVNIAPREELDPEELQSFLERCLERIRPIVERYEGTLARVLSGGAIASFGGTVAMEDHARRATLAALEIKQLLKNTEPARIGVAALACDVRIGLNSGLAIAARDHDGVPPAGDVINLTSRVLALAEPNHVLVTQDTWKLVKDDVEARSLDVKDSPRAGALLRLYEILGAKTLRTRLEIQAERGLTPFVGRRKEFALLRDDLAEAREGRGRLVLLAGEPGMGKSRLLLEFQRSLAGSEVGWVTGRCISFGAQMAYLPIIDLLKHLFGIEEAAEPESVARALESELKRVAPELEPALPYLKYLLALQSGDDSVARMDARERRVRIFESLRNLLLAKASKNPLVLAIEDVHWADKTSEEFLVSLADSISTARLFVLLSYRPGYRNPFPERSFITRLTLQPLTNAESLAVASQVLSEKVLPKELRQLVIGKADGNPFFVEEMVKSLEESGALGDRSPVSEASGAPAPLRVPDTIQDVIMSRIDRLDESPRTTLQLAAVIGREFSVSLLETIADLNEPLADSIQKLKSLELIYERAHLPEYTCIFKHVLTQEVAYNSLLLQRRKELHCLVAAAIEEMHSTRLPEFYELLAYHYERGEEWERALDYLRRAAEQCRLVGAYREEVLQLSRAIAITEHLGRAELIAELRGHRGTARVKIGMCAEAKPDLESALATMPVEDRARRAELTLSLAGAHFWGLDTVGTRRYGSEGLTLAQEAGRDDLAAEALTYLGASEQSHGNLRAATELFERARVEGGRFSAALANFPLTLYLNGRLADAVERGLEAAEVFRGTSDAFAANFSHPHLGLALAGCGRYTEAAAVFEEARQLGVKHEIWHFHARAVAMAAGFRLDVYDFRGNESLAREAIEHAHTAGFRPSAVSATIDLVFNFLRRGEIAQSERLIHEAQSLAAQVKGWHEWLWTLRIKQAAAELACAREDWAAALPLASEAIAESSGRGRAKYVIAGLETRARIFAALGQQQNAVADLNDALNRARAMGDPALFIRTAVTLLRVDGNDTLLAEARTTARRIAEALPNDATRQQFQSAEAIHPLGRIIL